MYAQMCAYAKRFVHARERPEKAVSSHPEALHEQEVMANAEFVQSLLTVEDLSITHGEPCGKDQTTYWSQAFKAISEETSGAMPSKEYRLCEEGGSEVYNCHIVLFKISNQQQKNGKTRNKNVIHLHRENTIIRNCP